MEYRKLTELKELPNNPRLIKDRQFKILCESIQNNPEYFEARPIILSDRTGELVIIAGNQRYKAAKHLKLKEVPTYLMENLTEEKEHEIIIRDNVSNGEWDFEQLSSIWDAEILTEWGVDIPFDKELDKDGNYKDTETLYDEPLQLHLELEYILVICDKSNIDKAREHFNLGFVTKNNGAKNKTVKNRTVIFNEYINSNTK